MGASTLATFEVHPGVPAKAAIIMLHGLGADGTDFLAFADEMKLDAVGPVHWVLPRAPIRPVTINGGYRMRAWYDIFQMAADVPDALTRREDEAGLRESFKQVHALIEREIERGVPAERIVLAGFSQGSAITLGAGLRCPHKLAGLAGLSGYLTLASATASERHAANLATPIFLAHGRNDGVVPLKAGLQCCETLASLGHTIEWHDYPMEHSVSAEEVSDLQRFLLRVLG
jgi:phospholipase/carboxylesterase